jgi:sulfate permease, SulP family
MQKNTNFLTKIFPILSWLPGYNRGYFQGDLSAGITVGIMLIPQGMAYSMLAGLDPIHGLYAVTIPLLIYAVFGSSRQLAVGPVAMVSLLTASGIAALQPENASEYLLYALTLAFLIGAIQLVMGIFRLGFIVNFLSHPVLNGFTSAAAIIIALSQVKHLFRIELPRSEHAHEMIGAIVNNISGIHWATFFIGLAGILIIKYGKKIHKKLPSSLLAVILGILVVWGFNLTDYGIVILGEVPSGLPSFTLPVFEKEVWSSLFPIALTISLVGFAESYAIAKTIQGKHKDYELNPNQELVGLGMANFGAALFNGYPVTGGFSRTAVNNDAGAKTGMASIISAGLIILTLLFFTQLFYFLPNAILAAVVIVAVAGLVDHKTPLYLWKKDKSDFLMLTATFLATLTLGIEPGIVIGLVLSLVAVIYKASNPHIAVLGKVPGTNLFRNIKRFKEAEVRTDILLVRIDGPIYFANVSYIKKNLDTWIEEKGNGLKTIILNMESVTSIDSTGIHELHDWISAWNKEHIATCFTGIRGPVRDTLLRWGILEFIGNEKVFIDDNTAIDFLDKNIDEGQIHRLNSYALQTNEKRGKSLD